MLLSKSTLLSLGFATAMTAAMGAHASVVYNTNGGNNLNGTDGQLPATWVGGGNTPSFTGTMNVMWFADLTNQTETLSTADAIAKGAPNNFILGVGPRAWSNVLGHGLDYGLIRLNGPTNLSITVSADSSLLVPGFSLYSGWDTGNTFDRLASYVNNIDNPLGAAGLTYLNQAATTTAGGSATFNFANLNGNYTLMLGGNNGAASGKYSVSLSASPVPVPGAVWLFGTVLAGFIGDFKRRKIG